MSEKHLIHFAIPHSTPLEDRRNWRGRVAQRFHGDPTTTRLVSVENRYRLYVMEEFKQ